MTIVTLKIIVVDDNSDLENIVKSEPEDNKIIQLPIQFDTDKIVLTDDGDVILIEPDNMQIEQKVLVPLGDGTIALPEQPQQMEVVRTRNLVLKRKGDDLDNIDLANIKIIVKSVNRSALLHKNPIFYRSKLLTLKILELR